MKKTTKFFLVALRVVLGGVFFYAGISKVLDPEWSAEGFLKGADFLSGFFSWLALPSNIVWVDFLNQWGLTLIGVSLIIGLLVRYSSIFGMLMMALYYIPELSTFPYIGEHSYIVDDHIVYIMAFGVLMSMCAGNYFGLDKFVPNCSNKINEEDSTEINY